MVNALTTKRMMGKVIKLQTIITIQMEKSKQNIYIIQTGIKKQFTNTLQLGS